MSSPIDQEGMQDFIGQSFVVQSYLTLGIMVLAVAAIRGEEKSKGGLSYEVKSCHMFTEA